MKVPSQLIANTYTMFYIHYILVNSVLNLKNFYNFFTHNL